MFVDSVERVSWPAIDFTDKQPSKEFFDYVQRVNIWKRGKPSWPRSDASFGSNMMKAV